MTLGNMNISWSGPFPEAVAELNSLDARLVEQIDFVNTAEQGKTNVSMVNVCGGNAGPCLDVDRAGQR